MAAFYDRQKAAHRRDLTKHRPSKERPTFEALLPEPSAVRTCIAERRAATALTSPNARATHGKAGSPKSTRGTHPPPQRTTNTTVTPAATTAIKVTDGTESLVVFRRNPGVGPPARPIAVTSHFPSVDRLLAHRRFLSSSRQSSQTLSSIRLTLATSPKKRIIGNETPVRMMVDRQAISTATVSTLIRLWPQANIDRGRVGEMKCAEGLTLRGSPATVHGSWKTLRSSI